MTWNSGRLDVRSTEVVFNFASDVTSFALSTSRLAATTLLLSFVLMSPKPARAEITTPASTSSITPAQTTPSPTKPTQLTQPIPVVGAPKTRGVELSTASSMRLNYGLRLWNKSAVKIDSASLLMRENKTGRIVQIHLEETAPDSSVFSGLYSITWANLDRTTVDFFVPPQELLDTNEGMRKVLDMVKARELKRHPFILHRTALGQQTVEIFDTREQAEAALKAFRAEQQLTTQANQKFPSDAAVATTETADDLREKRLAAHAVSERIRLEQVEAQRMQQMKEDAARQSAADTAERIAKGKAAASTGMNAFRAGSYIEAMSQFDDAVSADPNNTSYYYQYAVSLYKSDEFNKSLVYLKMAKGHDVDSVERDYYLGLNHFKLKEFNESNLAFSQVVASHNATLAPSAEFYQGVLGIQEKKWDVARDHFQSVIDTSKDPELDKRAESYLDQIIRLQRYEKERARKWQISATVGESYDSNILQSNNYVLDQGTASNSAGYRSLLMGSGRYRPLYNETHEFAVQADVLTMYSTSDKFKYSQTNRNADPTIASISAPWTYKGLVLNHGYKFDLVPAYESDWMSLENNTQKQILSSYYVDFNNLFVVNEKWFVNYNIELRKDNSKLDSSTGDNNANALKVKFTLASLYMMNDAKNKIITTDASYTSNGADGSNQIFDRWDASIGYIQPTWWNTTANAKLSYYYLNYPQAAPGRSDNDVALNLGATKPLSDIYNVGLLAGYSNNSSDVRADIYNRFSVLLTFSALVAF